VAASTQNQALSGVLFLYRDVLRQEVGAVELLPRARMPSKVPVVLTVAEVRKVLDALTGVPRIVAMLLYGAGLRLQECLELRVKDLDFERREITVRRGKGQKDRRVMLPDASRDALQHHLEGVRRMHHGDLAAGFGQVVLPGALDRKYPHAATDWLWPIRVSGWADLSRRTVRAADPIPPARVGDTAGGDRGRAKGGVGRAGRVPHISPFVRDPPTGSRVRHPHRPRTARSRRCQHDHDLHAHTESRRAGCEEPHGPVVAGVYARHLHYETRRSRGMPSCLPAAARSGSRLLRAISPGICARDAC
jgi:Phage integrase family